MAAPDPWQVLGLPPGSTLAEARAARRRLAKEFHPDLHGGRAELAAHMTSVNQALAAVEALWLAAAPVPAPAPASGRSPTTAEGRVSQRSAAAAARRGAAGERGGGPEAVARPEGPDDPSSFSVDCLPVEAFEALFLAAYGLGDILVADEPYLLELFLVEPAPCFCRLTLAPEAGGSLVTAEVSEACEMGPPPLAAEVVDVLVAELNSLVAR